VALTEGAHGSQDIYDFLSVVMLHPGFAVVDAVVVEWGNSLYQAVADDYVNGGMVRLSQLQRIWRNTTQSPANPLEHPTHHRLLSLARAINLFAGRPRPLRVLLADPPTDWTTITSADEYERSYHGVSRTDAWTGVILDEVMAKRQHCLTIGGGFHLMRGGYSLMGLDQPNVTDRIERHGHAVSVIHTHASAIAGRAGEIEQHLAGWARPAIATAAHASIAAFVPPMSSRPRSSSAVTAHRSRAPISASPTWLTTSSTLDCVGIRASQFHCGRSSTSPRTGPSSTVAGRRSRPPFRSTSTRGDTSTTRRCSHERGLGPQRIHSVGMRRS
jgi:hypothetical protein